MVVFDVGLAYRQQSIPSWIATLHAQWWLSDLIIVLLLIGLVFLASRVKNSPLRLSLISMLSISGIALCAVIAWPEDFSRSDTISLVGTVATGIGAIVAIITLIVTVLASRAGTTPPFLPPGLTPDEGLVRYMIGDGDAPARARDLKDKLKWYSFHDRKSHPANLKRLVMELERDLSEATYVFLVLSARRLGKLGRPEDISNALSRLIQVDNGRLTLLITGQCDRGILDGIERLGPIMVDRMKEAALLSELKRRIERARRSNEQMTGKQQR